MKTWAILRLACPCAEKNQQQIRTHKRALTDSARWEHHGLLSQNSEVHPEAKDTHIARRGRGMGDTLRECRPKPQRRRSIHQARSSTLEVRGTGRAQRRQTPQRSPYRRGSAATSALPSANYSLLYLSGNPLSEKRAIIGGRHGRSHLRRANHSLGRRNRTHPWHRAGGVRKIYG